MKLQTYAVNFDADTRLIEFIQKKAAKLETFYDRIIDGEVYLKTEAGSNDNKVVEIKLNIPGNQLFTKEQGESFEQAADMAVNALRRQLKKHKERLSAR